MSRATNGIQKTCVEGTAAAIKYEKGEHGEVTYQGKKVIKKMTELAWCFLELKLQNNRRPLKNIAEELDCSVQHLVTITNSPCYQEELSKYRTLRIQNAIERTTMNGLDRVDDMFQNSETEDKNVLRAVELLLEASGFTGGGSSGGGGSVNVNVNTPISQLGVTQDMIKEAQERRMRTFDGNCEEVKDEKEV